jgi:hypothetical protein
MSSKLRRIHKAAPAMRLAWTQAFLAVLLISLLAACSPPAPRTATIKQYRPRPANYPIPLFDGDVVEPYEPIATTRTRAYEEWEFVERGQADLMQAARDAGGDAVIHMKKEPSIAESVGYSPTTTLRAGAKLVTTFYYTGTIIRFKRDEIPGPKPAPAEEGKNTP